PHARSRTVQAEILFRFQVQQNGFSFEMPHEHVLGNDHAVGELHHAALLLPQPARGTAGRFGRDVSAPRVSYRGMALQATRAADGGSVSRYRSPNGARPATIHALQS